MKVSKLPKKMRFVVGTLIIAALAAVLVITRTDPPARAFPTTALTFLGLTNLPPVGVMTAFGISNGSPRRLIYNPKTVEYRTSNEWIAVPSDSIVNRAGVVAPGQTYVFYVLGVITNHSLRIQMVCREQAAAEGLLAKAENLVRKTGNGKTEAWLGKRCEATLTEANK